MEDGLSEEIGLLRTLVRNTERTPIPADPRVAAFWREHGVEVPPGDAGSKLTIRPKGRDAFVQLANCITDRIPAMERGAIFNNVQVELFKLLESYVGRDAGTIARGDVEKLLERFETWFRDLAHPRNVFVPCVITPWPAPRFDIGPITFVFIEDVASSDLYPAGPNLFTKTQFDDLIELMRRTHGNWLARVAVEGCERERAEEIAELAVDLAIAALQLAAPNLDTRSMCRLDVRRGFVEKQTLSESNGHYNWGTHRKEPGLAIGQGTLQAVLNETKPVITAAGHVVASFTSGNYRLPKLERAWCDAAYWMRESLFDSIDGLAVTKLETALEVLVCTESSKYSTARLMLALQNFLDLQPDDQMLPPFALTTKQFVTRLVRDRSRILHGTWSTLNARLAIRRDGLEAVVGAVMRQAVVQLDAYAQEEAPEDDIDAFLSWLKRRSAAGAPSAGQ